VDNRGVVGQSAVVTDAPDATNHPDHAYGESGRDVMWFGVWSVIGAAYALAAIGAMTIGVFVLPLAVLATVFTGRQRRAAVGLPGLVSGAAFPLLYVAYLNREGPGMVCTATRGGQSCTDEWSPWPWLAIAAALLVAGAIVFVRRRSTVPRG
jgi:hypothetical protein